MSSIGKQCSLSNCCAWDCVLVPAPAAQSRGVLLADGAGILDLSQHGLNHHFPSSPVPPQGAAMTHRAGWPGPGFGVGGEPVRGCTKHSSAW